MQTDDNVEIIPARISGHDNYNDYQPTIAEGDKKANIEDKLTTYSRELGLDTLKFR